MNEAPVADESQVDQLLDEWEELREPCTPYKTPASKSGL